MISVSLTGSWGCRGLQGRWSHQSCWRPALTGPAFGSLLVREWSGLPRPPCSCATVRKESQMLPEWVKTKFLRWSVWKSAAEFCKHRFSPVAGCFFAWSITMACCWLGANNWKLAPLRLRWYIVLRTETSVTARALHNDWALGKLPYSLHSLVDVSPIPPAASGEHLGRSVIHASQSHQFR